MFHVLHNVLLSTLMSTKQPLVALSMTLVRVQSCHHGWHFNHEIKIAASAPIQKCIAAFCDQLRFSTKGQANFGGHVAER